MRGTRTRWVAATILGCLLAGPALANPVPAMPPERIEADISTRSIAVGTDFKGTEIIVFGTVENSRQTTAESGFYDVVVVVEGTPLPLIARRKSNVAGLWVNTAALNFLSVPSYYAISSSRPLDEIAELGVLEEHAIGFEQVNMVPSARAETAVTGKEMETYKQAVVRLRRAQGLYVEDNYGVGFIGRSLFRSTVELPANIPVGELQARVYLFHEGKILSEHKSRLRLQREGVERVLYDFAVGHPVWYGILAAIVACVAGLLASAAFRRAPG